MTHKDDEQLNTLQRTTLGNTIKEDNSTKLMVRELRSLQIISLGLGVQSTALYFMSSMGQLPRADYAIVADPGKEKSKSYQYLSFLQHWQQQNNGITIIVEADRNLFQDLLHGVNTQKRRFTSIPAYTRNEDGSKGMLRRQCTSEYKIKPIDNCIRSLYGLRPRQRRPLTYVWKGISLDESLRMSKPEQKWKVHVYPFTGYAFSHSRSWQQLTWGIPINRANLYNWYATHHLPIPVKSSCVFCPFQSDANWQRMKNEEPDDFAAAIQVDLAIRNSTTKGINSPCYLHRSLQPLGEVQFNSANDLWKNDCSGNCHL